MHRQASKREDRSLVREILQQWEPNTSEENFQEAYNMIAKSTTPYRVPSEITELFTSDQCNIKV
jgi:hypothetical protein